MVIDLLHATVRWRFEQLGMKNRVLELQDCRLHFHEYVHPRPRRTLVLVHGLGTSSSTWLRIIPSLLTDHRVLAVDLPGFGSSALKPGKLFYTLDEQRSALAELFHHLGDRSFTLIGHSFGGWLSASYATQHPHRVNHLILLNTAGVYYEGIETLRDPFTVRSVTDMRKLLNVLWWRYPWYFKPFTQAIFREISARRMNDVVASIEAKDLLVEEFARLRMPVTLIWGREDRAVSAVSAQTIRKLVPLCDLHFIDRCGHVPQLEKPRDVERILHRVLNEEVLEQESV